MLSSRRRLVPFALIAFAAGCSSASTSSPPESSPAAASVSSKGAAESVDVAPSNSPAPSHESWRRTLAKTPLPKDGCFEATAPSTTWVEVPCSTARHSPPPHEPVNAGAGTTVENTYPGAVLGPLAADASPTGDDHVDLDGSGAAVSPNAPGGAVSVSGGKRPMTSASESSGTIAWAEGSFPYVSGLTSETSGGTSNNFSIQLNTQSNLTNSTITALCKQTATPSTCAGWVQFVYWQGDAEIWYNLVKTGSTCPSGWSNQKGSCYLEAPNFVKLPSQAISNLTNMTVSGLAGATSDTVIVTTGPEASQAYAAKNTSTLVLAPEWNYADFNVLGNGSLGNAAFNSGTTLGVQLLTGSATGSASAPSCSPGGNTTGETNNLSFVTGSCCTFGGPSPGIQFTESYPAGAQAFACPPSALQPSGGPIAVTQQFGLEQTDVISVDDSGELNLTWAGYGAPWTEPAAIGGTIFPAGAPVAASQQFGFTQTDVFAVDSRGNLDVAWVGSSGGWQGPTTIVSGAFNAGAHVATSQQFGAPIAQTDVFAVDKYGAATVTWSVGGGAWQTGEISPRNVFPPGAPLAASQQIGQAQTDLFIIDNEGRLEVLWASGGGAWAGPAVIGGQFAAGAYIAASQQFGTSSTDVFAVDTSGNLDVAWVNGTGAFNGPVRITSSAPFPSGAPVAAGQQLGASSAGQTDVFAVSTSGALEVTWVDGAGGWQGPNAVGSGTVFPQRANIAMSPQFGVTSQTDVFVTGSSGYRSVAWVDGSGAFNGPTQIP